MRGRLWPAEKSCCIISETDREVLRAARQAAAPLPKTRHLLHKWAVQYDVYACSSNVSRVLRTASGAPYKEWPTKSASSGTASNSIVHYECKRKLCIKDKGDTTQSMYLATSSEDWRLVFSGIRCIPDNRWKLEWAVDCAHLPRGQVSTCARKDTAPRRWRLFHSHRSTSNVRTEWPTGLQGCRPCSLTASNRCCAYLRLTEVNVEGLAPCGRSASRAP